MKTTTTTTTLHYITTGWLNIYLNSCSCWYISSYDEMDHFMTSTWPFNLSHGQKDVVYVGQDIIKCLPSYFIKLKSASWGVWEMWGEEEDCLRGQCMPGTALLCKQISLISIFIPILMMDNFLTLQMTNLKFKEIK